jgi:putative ABC transport system permease protein
MLRNYLITAIRFLTKNQLFTSINTIGLAVSISCTMLIYLYLKNEFTFDEFHKDIDRLYILGEGSRDEDPEEAAYYQTVYPALPAMLHEFAEIETGTRYFDWDAHILIVGDKKFMQQVLYADSTFLQTLSFPLITGDAASALGKKGRIVIAEEIALKLFNSTDVLGKTIQLENEKEYIITGVLDKIPDNSSIRPQVLLSLMEKEDDRQFQQIGNWYNTIAHVIVKLKPKADVSQLRAKLPAFIKQHYDPAAKARTLKVYPLRDLHQSEVDNETVIYGLASIGVFILLIAVINFMNLSIAASLKRLRETGMRKVMGSSRRSIVLQFFLEAFLLSLVAIAISVGMLQLALPILNEILSMSLNLSAENLTELLALSVVLAIFIGLVAGGYPAAYLSSYKTVNAVKGIIPNYQGKVTLRNALVVVQFVVSVSMIIGVIAASRQIQYMKSADLKFDRENVVVVNNLDAFKNPKAAAIRLTGILNDLQQNPDVLSVSFSQNIPGRYWENYDGFIPEGGTEPVGLRQANVDDRYLETYGINILEGRNFSAELATDTLNKVMINRAALKALAWDSAVGKALKSNGSETVFTVIGVFDDFHYRSLQGSVQPLIHFYGKKIENAGFISIKMMPGKVRGIVSTLEKEWRSLDSWLDFNYFFIDEEFDKQYKDVDRTFVLITFFAAIAIVISCAGIFALSAIAAQQRTKEIGIRKVLGASVASIIGLLSKDFIKLVGVAIALAAPCAWYGMSQWLEDFAYKVDLDWWIFALAGAIALAIAFFTTGLQSVKAALNNPVTSLRND